MFDVKTEGKHLRIEMSATLENIDGADERASSFLAATHAPIDLFATRILLRESMLNAVTHGSGCDPSQIVRLDVEVDDLGVVLTVEDTGPGFIWQDRQTEFDILGDGGRGLALMQLYASEMNYNEAGNRVVLRRTYEASETELADRGSPTCKESS